MSRLEPLTCQSCRAPVPLGEGAEVQCPSCDGRQPLPESYRALRDARRLSAEAAKELDSLCADVARPPPAWKRIAIIVGYVVGGLTILILAIGAIVGAIAGLIGAAKADAGDTIGAIIVVLCTAVCGLVSVPLVGELLVFTIQHGGFQMAKTLVMNGTTNVEIDLWVGAVLYLFAVVPIAVAYSTQVKLVGLERLRLELAAKPIRAGGPLGCRSCGAPLEVTAGAIATRCLYCGTESLVNVTEKAAKKEKGKALELHDTVQDCLAMLAAARSTDRKNMWKMLVAGPLLLPLVVLGGVVFHLLADV